MLRRDWGRLSESSKNEEDNELYCKTKTIYFIIKLTENANIQKVIAIHWREASGGQQHNHEQDEIDELRQIKLIIIA